MTNHARAVALAAIFVVLAPGVLVHAQQEGITPEVANYP